MLRCCAACRGGAREGTMQLTCLSLAHFLIDSCVRLGVSPTVATALSTLSLSFSLSQPRPQGPTTCSGFSPLATLEVCCLTGLVVLADFFFNSLVVRVPNNLIFWHFWLFIDFRLVFIHLVVQGSEGFLPTPPSWLELTFIAGNAI